MAFWAAGVGGLFEVAAVATVAVLADEHAAFFGFDFEEEFAAIWAWGAGHVVVAVLFVGIFHGFDEFCGEGAHVAGEGSGFFLAAGDALEAFFPVGGEERRGEIVGDDVDELDAFGGWHEGLALLFNIEAFEQFLDDVGAGGWGADAAGFVENRLGVLVADKSLGIFHGGQERAFGEAGWRFGLAFADADGDAFQGLALLEFWQGAILAGVFFLLVFVANEIKAFPAEINGDVAAGGETLAVHVEGDAGLLVFIRSEEVGQKTLHDELVNAALIAGEVVLAEAFLGWDDGVVVADFGVVDAPWCDAAFFGADLASDVGVAVGCESGETLREGGYDIFREIAGIGARIGEQLVLFVEPLHQRKRLLGAESVAGVGVTLEGGEVVERWRLGAFFLRIDARHGGGLFVAGADDALASALIVKTSALIFALIEQAHAVHICEHFVIRCALKITDGALALHDHCERRRLHAASGKLRVVATGEGAGGVEANDPVGFAARLGGAVEVVVFCRWLEMGEALADGLVGLAGDPETAHRLFDVRFFNDPARDELAFAAGVGGDDDLANVGAFHQAGNCAELLAGLRDDDEVHVLWQDRQRVHAPGFVFFAVMLRIGQRDKMAQCPGDDVFLIFKITVVFSADAQHAGELAANGWFFCKYEGFSHDDLSSLWFSISIAQAAAAVYNKESTRKGERQ